MTSISIASAQPPRPAPSITAPFAAVSSLAGASAWLNSPPLSASQLRGHVVLVDFWTYSCINWRRQAPFLRAWAQRYESDGLVVIGVHSPEFSFEYDLDNVRRALKDGDIGYPVAVDNAFAVWKGFSNDAWPALYLIDARGRLRYHHAGEGETDRIEATIRQLLVESGRSGVPRRSEPIMGRGVELAAEWNALQSPETYLGYARARHFTSRDGAAFDRSRDYAIPGRLQLNEWALSGRWTIGEEAAKADAAHASIVFRFHARDAHLVAGPARNANAVRIRVRLDGREPGAEHGDDVDADGYGSLDGPRLYQLIRQRGPIVDRNVEVEFLDAGAALYSFTFG